MLSPFPGMDPFLEGSGEWSDFHSCFPLAAKTLLAPQLPPGFHLLAEKELYIHEPSAEDRGLTLVKPDTAVARNALAPGGHGGTNVAVAERPTTTAPVRRRLPDVIEEEVKRLVIRGRRGRDVVTVIELLSPVNKIRHRGAYEQKRRQVLASDTHLVEIDLLRAGRHMTFRDAPPSDFLVSVSRREDRPDVDLWAFGLRDPLPTVPIPLRDGNAVALDLRALLDAVWQVSAYDDLIYEAAPAPPLSPADAEWAAGVLNTAGVPLPPDFPPPNAAAPDSAE